MAITADYTLTRLGGLPDVLPLVLARSSDRSITIATGENLTGAVLQWVVKLNQDDPDNAELVSLDNVAVGGITILQPATAGLITLTFPHSMFSNRMRYPDTPKPVLDQACKVWFPDGSQDDLWEGTFVVRDFGISSQTPPQAAVLVNPPPPPTLVPVCLGTYRVRHFVAGQPQADSAQAYNALVGQAPGWLHFFQDAFPHVSEPTAAPSDVLGVARANEVLANGRKDGSNNPVTAIVISYSLDDYTVTPEQNQPAWSNASILSGAHDAAMNTFFTQAAAWGHPLLINPMWEMTGAFYPWAAGANGNSPASFIAAWKYVVNFGRARASLVKYIWCPSVDIPGAGLLPVQSCWPGDAYVDYLGMNGYNKGKTSQHGAWYSFDQVFHATYDALCALSQKDIMIVETSCDSDAGANIALKVLWLQGVLPALRGMTRIRAVNFFSKPFGAQNYSIDETPATLAAFQALAADSYMQGTLDLS